MPFNPFEGAFGLDMGDLTFKLVRIHSIPKPFKTEFKLLSYGRASLPPGAIEKGEIIQPEPLIKILKELVRQTKWRKAQNWVVAGLPENKTFLKYLTIEPDEELTPDAIQALMEEHIPFDPGDLYSDWQLMPPLEEGGKPGLLLTAATKQTVDSYTYLLEIAGLSPIAFELESIALARALIEIRRAEKTEKGDEKKAPPSAYGILDMGATQSTLVIYDNHSVQLSRSFSFSGNHITELIAAMFKLPKEKADAYKHERGFEPKNYNQREWTILAREIDQLVNDTEQTMQFYQKQSAQNRAVETIYVCGGGANYKGLEQLLAARLKRTVHAGNPWHNLFTKKISPLTQADLNSYTTAIGLALRAADNPLVKKDDV